MLLQDGLEWVMTTFGLEPRWTKEPDIETIREIARKHLGHDKEASIEVAFHAQGGFNKLYKITAAEATCIMRVSLPVYPKLKTQSEVATIDFIRKKTGMPVPQIIAFDADNQNSLGFEWILMELMPGVPLRMRWRRISWDAKKTLICQLASFQAQLKQRKFKAIGNLISQEQGDVVMGPIVSLAFFWGDHLTHDVPRRPFTNSYEWLQTRLQFAIVDQNRILKTSDDEDDLEDAEFAKSLAEEIAQELPKVFAFDITGDEQTMLFHDDLSMQNILVDEEGRLTAIIDWECVSVVPMWRACQFPQLLEGRARDEKPDRSQYGTDPDDEENYPTAPDALDNEGITVIYWEHLLEYEQTQLRQLFKEEMAKIDLEWLAIMQSGTLESDFEQAVHSCDNGWVFKRVKLWLGEYKAGNSRRLTEMILY